jgi:DNA invertase Pin-like site-specific DNA recombinase
MAEGNYIAYYRVSTERQGQSGLGLQAQQKAIADYLNGGNWQLLAEYTEIESGKKTQRPELQKALDACKKAKATLVIAKLDRLGRNVAFIASLMESKVEFLAVDNPHANRLMLHMLAAFAEHEREQISQRTKAALGAAKRRGVELGKNGKEKLAPQNKADADAFAQSMAPIIKTLHQEGYTTVRALCAELNARHIPTVRLGGMWHLATVHQVLRRGKRLQCKRNR